MLETLLRRLDMVRLSVTAMTLVRNALTGAQLFDAELAVLARDGDAGTRRAELEPPVHILYSTWGERIDEIQVSDAYVALGRVGVEAGVTALPYEDTPYGAGARVVWGALLSLWGPSSALYSCPIAMTDGAAEILAVKVAGLPSGLRQGHPVKVTGLVAQPWTMNDRAGVAFRAARVEPVVAQAKAS